MSSDRPARDGRILQGGRLKAYRPLPADERAAALAAGLEAYQRGDVFEAHELLEPAWMGTADLAERDLYQGLIKLAAGCVHAVRGNPRGVVTNLTGARTRLAAVISAGGPDAGIDLPRLIDAIDDRLAAAATLAPTPGRALALEPPRLVRRGAA
jgi:predicted metal-dependent hydrolase